MWFRKRSDADFQAEIEAHVRLEADRLIEEGVPSEQSKAAARRAFGNITTAQEKFYESHHWMLFDELRQDLRYGIRSMWRARAFAMAAMLTIALGVGANTAVFSLMDAVLLRLLPVDRPSELVFLETAGSAGASGPPPYPCFARLRAETSSFTGMSAFSSDELPLEIDGKPEQVMGQVASGNYFDVLGVQPLLGRLLTPDDETLNPPVAVISERYWRRRFAADPSVIGKSVSFRKRAFMIVGVTPSKFFGLFPGSPVDITLPISSEGRLLADSSAHWLQGIVGRLKPGTSMAKAQSEADVVYRSFMASSRYPADIVAKHFHHMEAHSAAKGIDALHRRFSRPLYALMGIVGMLLLLTVANIANLLLGRGISRSREFAIRLAAGAGRARLVRQLLTETILLFCLGAIPGIALANWGVGFLESLFREGRRAVTVDADLNWRVLGFSLLVTIASGVVSGLVPIWRAFRTDPEQAIKEGQSRSTESRGTGSLTQALVAIQVGLSLVLLVGALLFARTLSRLRHVDLGFRTDSALTMSIQLPESTDAPVALWTRALEAVREIPGVHSAAVATYTPLSGRDRGALVQIRGYQSSSSEDSTIHTNQVSEGYFESLGFTLIRGRLFTDRDADGAVKVAIINESATRKFFGERDPIGQSLEFVRKNESNSYRIIGVVRDTKHMNLRETSPRFAFIPIRQPRDGDQRVTLVVTARQPGKEAALMPPIRNVLARINPGILISDVITIRTQLDSTLLTERLLSGLSAVFGFVATILAAVGLYGVLSYRVSRQRQAIGVRMALGATQATVTQAILWQSIKVVAIGLAVGLPAAVVAARMAESMLWGVGPTDPLVYIAGVGVLFLVAVLSAYFPARRAAAIEPAEALRMG